MQQHTVFESELQDWSPSEEEKMFLLTQSAHLLCF